MIVVVPIILLAAGVGAWIGWMLGTSELERPELDPLAPVFIEGAEGDKIYRRRRLIRIVLTVLGAVAGAAAGVLFLFWLARRG